MEINFLYFKFFIFIILFIILFISFILYKYFYAKWLIDHNLYPYANLIRDNRVK